MKIAKLLQNGQDQVIKLPVEYKFLSEEVYIKKVGDTLMIFPKDRIWETFLQGLNEFTDDFMSNRRDIEESLNIGNWL